LRQIILTTEIFIYGEYPIGKLGGEGKMQKGREWVIICEAVGQKIRPTAACAVLI
jgi:hypothetical protein